MKTCTYCAEEIQDAAIVCRWCTRPVLQKGRKLSCLGQIYTIGRADDCWAIWNLITGGAPVREFPQTDDGWKKAWGEYKKLEKPPSNVTWMVGGFIPLDW